MRIDLNADVGEGFDDERLMPLVTSVNVACGVHAGDEATIRRAVEAAKRSGVVVGAHPSAPDREGFGRRDLTLGEAALEACVVEQVRFVAAIARERGVALAHVKPHGALYNRAAVGRDLARTVARAVAAVDCDLALVGLAGSLLLEAARETGLRPVAEAFADRRYRGDGTLAPRAAAGAVIDDARAAAKQAAAIVLGEPIEAIDGGRLRVRADTICIHADTPHALAIAAAVVERLRALGVELAPIAAQRRGAT